MIAVTDTAIEYSVRFFRAKSTWRQATQLLHQLESYILLPFPLRCLAVLELEAGRNALLGCCRLLEVYFGGSTELPVAGCRRPKSVDAAGLRH